MIPNNLKLLLVLGCMEDVSTNEHEFIKPVKRLNRKSICLLYFLSETLITQSWLKLAAICIDQVSPICTNSKNTVKWSFRKKEQWMRQGFNNFPTFTYWKCTNKLKKKNNKNSGHFIPLQRLRAVHALCWPIVKL